jgi:DNA integrity scanning protein DisA with diadenylate cyclase activity
MALIGYQKQDEAVMSKGYRLLNKTSLSKSDIENLIKEIAHLNNIFDNPEKAVAVLGEAKANLLSKELSQLKEQVLLNKKI